MTLMLPSRRGRLPKPQDLSPLFYAAGSVTRTAELLEVSRWTLWRWNKKGKVPQPYRLLVNVWCRHLGVAPIFPDVTRLSEVTGLGYLSKLAPRVGEDVEPQVSGLAKVRVKKRKSISKEKRSWHTK